MNFKIGPRTFSIPSARLPKFNIPNLRFISYLHIPFPKRLQFGSARVGLISLGVVAIGFAGTLFLVIAGTNSEILWPTAGAEYSLPNTVGQKLPSDDHTPLDPSMTLRINLADGTRLDRLHIKDVSLGKAGLAESFLIDRTTGVTGAMVNVGKFIITNSSAPTLDWSNMEIGELTVGAMVDGHTNAAVLDATISNQVILSDRGSGTYIVQGAVTDRIILNLNGDNGATIRELIIDDVHAHTGAFDWQYMSIGVMEFGSTNSIGDGSGINSSSAVINDTVKARVINDSLVDTPIKVQ